MKAEVSVNNVFEYAWGGKNGKCRYDIVSYKNNTKDG